MFWFVTMICYLMTWLSAYSFYYTYKRTVVLFLNWAALYSKMALLQKLGISYWTINKLFAVFNKCRPLNTSSVWCIFNASWIFQRITHHLTSLTLETSLSPFQNCLYSIWSMMKTITKLKVWSKFLLVILYQQKTCRAQISFNGKRECFSHFLFSQPWRSSGMILTVFTVLCSK